MKALFCQNSDVSAQNDMLSFVAEGTYFGAVGHTFVPKAWGELSVLADHSENTMTWLRINGPSDHECHFGASGYLRDICITNWCLYNTDDILQNTHNRQTRRHTVQHLVWT